MVDLDLDILAETKKTIKINGKTYEFKNVTMAEHLENELMVQRIEAIPLKTNKDILKFEKKVNEYLNKIIDLQGDTINLTTKQYQAIRKYLERKDMYDQGFTDEEMDKIEREALKNRVAQLK